MWLVESSCFTDCESFFGLCIYRGIAIVLARFSI
ncbi:hypothetical protein NSE_0602 [Neorickettsia sennetsu str. Miyayama]|uniref:Uncharacterized protein n=1 Tax=Ehrlichia sennetsu (strain ATCC VR-367 / Miyayama) TaxID=222891 RepID=Q2GDG4_EHRS3|nr:hypothetical protein NSE_0602 [Neorickettsia sennetsu str. Miyayama]